MIRRRPIAVLASALALAAVGCNAPTSPPPIAKTPIRHLIVVVGENMSFDNLFGTYEPPPGQTVANLLSKGIVKADGSPGAYFGLAAQRLASVRDRYLVTPQKTGAYRHLPQPGTTYALDQPKFQPDKRFPASLPNGPFPITRYAEWTAAVGDPVHRFFQMWQQVDGGRRDLFVWVAATSGEGSQKRDDPGSSTNQGGVAMGFYNMAQGDAATFRELARTYALADNYHQPVMGGTGANYIALSTADAAPYLLEGRIAAPPVNQIENPDPRPGTNNWYTQSGYRSGSYVQCADASQPGVKTIRDYLGSLPYKTFNDGNCEPGAFYLVNNYGTGFNYAGERKPLGADQYTLPPQVAPTIGEALAAKGVTWKWYQGGRTADGIVKELYCDICDPFTHSTAIMTGPLKANLVSLAELDRDLASPEDMPAVAFVTPPNPESGHPAYSYAARYEAFVKDLVAKVEAHPDIWIDAAILVTTDEGGGYYDSGYIQILDFFGDGTRIPFLAISRFAKPGFVDHTYYDHASILKFIEMNWALKPLSPRSRDNLPNPVATAAEPYVPLNRPAIGDLTNLFQF
ncbi:MAG TPA: alkaline phosphatase family protein [Stellaceae bacterium]|nr:alkaline phosphatase family protein [Stellaceae bacterium]